MNPLGRPAARPSARWGSLPAARRMPGGVMSHRAAPALAPPRRVSMAEGAPLSASNEGNVPLRGLENLPLPEGDMGLPVIGHSLAFIKSWHEFVAGRMSKYGFVSKASLMGKPAAVIGGKVFLQKVFVREPDLLRQGLFTSISRLMGDNALMNLDGKEHKRIRSLMCVPFSKSGVHKRLPEIARLADEHCRGWLEKGSILFAEEAQDFAFTVVAEGVLGMRFPVGNTWPKDRVLEIFRMWMAGLLSFGIDLPFTTFGKAMHARRLLIEMINTTIENLGADPSSESGLKSMLDAVGGDGSHLTKEQLVDTVLLLLYAGHDTSAGTASMMMLQLGQHRKVWERMREEQDEVVAQHGPEMSAAALEAMPYTEAVLRESMRLKPAASGGVKVASRTFEIGGRRIPKGWTVIPGNAITAAYFDPRWPHDLEFRPERHLTDGVVDASPPAVFSMGPHLCLGWYMSIMENKILLATMARGYEFSIADVDPQVVMSPIPTPVDGLPMTVARRGAPASC